MRKKILTFFLVLNIHSAYSECLSYIDDEWQDSRYHDHNDGTITDLQTGLMWKQCPEGQTGPDCCEFYGPGNECLVIQDYYHTWEQALQYPVDLNNNGGFAGYTDWRLPNINELRTLAAINCSWPAINQNIFKRTSLPQLGLDFWSSTPASLDRQSYIIHFNLGTKEPWNRDDTNVRIRLVRSE